MNSIPKEYWLRAYDDRLKPSTIDLQNLQAVRARILSLAWKR